MEKISVRQICFILVIYNVSSKLLMYPTMLAQYSGNDLLFSALIDFFIQAVVVWAIAYLSSRTEMTFFGLLSNTFGKVTARVIFGIFGLFFMLAAIYPVFEQKLYVHTIFYDTVPSLLVFLPFFFFSVYVGAKGFKNIGRCAEICLPIFIVSFLCVVIMSVGECKLAHLLPILKRPAADIFIGSAATYFRFLEPAFLLMFLGHFKYKRGDAAKITLSYILGALIVMGFLTIFYSIYGNLSVSMPFAVSKTSLYFSAISTIGRIDLIALYLLETVTIFSLVLNIQLAVYCFKKCIGKGLDKAFKNLSSGILSLLINAVILTILVVFNHYFYNINFVYVRYLPAVFFVFTTLIPVLCWALKKRKKEGGA